MTRIALNWGGIKIAILVTLGALISCLSAFINKYPFVYPDTASYIYSGFNGLVFDDRPIFYGLFLRHVSLHESPWFVVFGQSLILSYTIYLTFGMFFHGIRKNYLFISTILFLAISTAFSFVAGILTPDVFTPITLLCFINLLINKSLSKMNTVCLSIFFVIGICTQLSTLVILLFVFPILGIIIFIRKRKLKSQMFDSKKISLTFYLWLSCFLIIPGVHYAFSGRFVLSGAGHVFIMNHFLETGILSEYLNEECDSRNYKICSYKDKLDWNFIWSEDSPVQKTGGWSANKQEYSKIIGDILSRPKYLLKLSVAGIQYTVKQFFKFDTEVQPAQLEGTQTFIQVGWRFKNTKASYASSLQNKNAWSLKWLNFAQWIVFIMSILFILGLLFNRKLKDLINPEFRTSVALLFLFMVTSCFVCSNLSTIDARFQSRLVWLFPMFALIALYAYKETIQLFSEKKPK
ncbi:MAG: hypothetical protein JNL60_03530 [Bacteroidia bacterium]|nr:hypothetical protein [Bacteroidia bacterium]